MKKIFKTTKTHYLNDSLDKMTTKTNYYAFGILIYSSNYVQQVHCTIEE